jgi:spore photoproduct lyase
MDCRYCALQVYFNRPVLEVFVNVKDLLRDLQRCLRAQPWRFRRFCTGEFTDSLALDPLTGLSARLVEFFSRVDNACLEIKTKTDLVDPLLGLDPRGRVIVSFSVNSAGNSRGEERRAASLSSRLAAAAKIQEGGYLLGFHFDPIIPVPGWQDGYSQTVDAIFRSADPSRIAWISLGVLRFVPELKQVATARHGPIPYFHNGFVRGLDGKSRLPVARRIEIYRLLAKRIARHWPDARIYLCMESPYVWQKSLGVPIRSDDDLIKYLDDAVTGDTSALSSK